MENSLHGDEMQVNVAGLRRNIKNLAHNYSDAQVKVREATSNDPWGPSSTLMAEIADLTYNVMAFTEIMQMIWKRLNDHGKNWRHVYKALVLMEYLIKTGSEKVAMQCKENIFAIHTLKDFQYMEEGKDQGLNVREKAKQLVHLLKDEERLKNERARALKAKQRFAQSASAFGSDGALDTPSSPTYPALGSGGSLGSAGAAGSGGSGGSWSGREAELARPLTAGEEELQLQLALAMSREEAEREERRRRSDDVRLQLAISQSQNDFQSPTGSGGAVGAVGGASGTTNGQQSHLLDLLDVTLPQEPWPQEQKQPDTLDVSIFSDSMDTSSEAWSGVNSPARDPWAPLAANSNPDPWAPLAQSKSPVSVISSPSSELEQFDALSQRPVQRGAQEADPFDLSALNDNLTPSSTGAIKKSPSAFLGENSSLVNLERLLPPAPPNPFAAEPPKQMFATPQPAKLSINEIKQQQMGLAPNLSFPSSSPAFSSPLTLGTMAPINNTMPPLNNTMAPLNNTLPPLNNTMPPLNNTMAPLSTAASLSSTMAPLGNSMAPLGNSMAPLGNSMAPLGNSMAPLGNSMAPLGNMGLGPGAPASDPWAPARSSSPWSPPPTRHTPNPFLS
ncbi:unnamed protein product [Colias eurytheme]|nr:unnamed protein product [Colias eurytheme]